jgi:serine/threonine protein kinase
VAVGATLGAIVGLILLGIMVARARWRYLSLQPHDFGMLDGDTPVEIPRRDITLLECIGSGAFGEVWKATLKHGSETSREHDIVVAAKRVKLREGRPSDSTALHTPGMDTDYDNKLKEENGKLLDEAVLMAKVGYHNNLVTIIGVVTSGNEPHSLIISFCEHGSLLRVLKTNSSGGKPFTELGALDIGLNIAHGMQHLVEQSVIHRDLAARNVMVASGNTSTGYVARVADFGLSRKHVGTTSEEEYYRSASGVFPLRWTALEGIDEQKFTQASDVWSFAIVMIEIYQDGMRPYPNIPSNAQVFTFKQGGGRHAQPKACPMYAYRLLLACWNEAASKRPTFLTLLATGSVMQQTQLAADASVEGKGGEVHLMPQTSPSLSHNGGANMPQTSPSLSHNGGANSYQYDRNSEVSIKFPSKWRVDAPVYEYDGPSEGISSGGGGGGGGDVADYEYDGLVNENASGSGGTGEEGGGGAGGGGSSAGDDGSGDWPDAQVVRSGSAAAGGALLDCGPTSLMAMSAGESDCCDAQGEMMRSMSTPSTAAEMNVNGAPHHHQTARGALLEGGMSLRTVTQL